MLAGTPGGYEDNQNGPAAATLTDVRGVSVCDFMGSGPCRTIRLLSCLGERQQHIHPSRKFLAKQAAFSFDSRRVIIFDRPQIEAKRLTARARWPQGRS